MQHQQDDEADRAATMDARREARRGRQFSYEINKIRQNDPSILAVQITMEEYLPSLVKAMEQNTLVVDMEIACLDLGIGGMVGNMLRKRNSTLKKFKIISCHVPDYSATAIFRSLSETRSTLQELDLSLSWGMFERHDTLDLNGPMEALSHLLACSSSLCSLTLRRTEIDSDQVATLFGSISCSKSLETLDLSENSGIGPAVVDSLIQYLPRLHLQVLNVELTGISECLDQQDELMDDLCTSMEKNTSLWKLTGIILHQVDHYPSEEERDKQRKCVQFFQRLEYFKTRNAILSDNWLRMDSLHLWPLLLADAAKTSNQFCNDMLFFLLREKCSWLRTRNSIRSCEATPKQSNGPSTTEAATAAQRKRSSNWILQPPPSKKPNGHFLKEDPFIILGYSCLVHATRGILPQGCCSFERRSITPNT
jgi:hypothetical protein